MLTSRLRRVISQTIQSMRGGTSKVPSLRWIRLGVRCGHSETAFSQTEVGRAAGDAARERKVRVSEVRDRFKRVHPAGTTGRILRDLSWTKQQARRCSDELMPNILWETRSVWGYSGSMGVTTVHARRFAHQ